MRRLGVLILTLPILFYRKVISPLKPPTCRFHPECSKYALIALRRHGIFRGSWLTIRRLLRCHPFHPGGEVDTGPLRQLTV